MGQKKGLIQTIIEWFEDNGPKNNFFSWAMIFSMFMFCRSCVSSCNNKLESIQSQIEGVERLLERCDSDKTIADQRLFDCLNNKGYVTGKQCLELITERLTDIDRQKIFDCVETLNQ